MFQLPREASSPFMRLTLFLGATSEVSFDNLAASVISSTNTTSIFLFVWSNVTVTTYMLYKKAKQTNKSKKSSGHERKHGKVGRKPWELKVLSQMFGSGQHTLSGGSDRSVFLGVRSQLKDTSWLVFSQDVVHSSGLQCTIKTATLPLWKESFCSESWHCLSHQTVFI